MALCNALSKSLDDDKKISFADVANFWEPLKASGAAFDGIGNVSAEVVTMSEAEKAQIVGEILKLSLADKKSEMIIELSAKVGLDLCKIISIMKSK